MGNLQKPDRQDIFGMSIIAYGTKSKPLFPDEAIADWLGHSDVSAMLRDVNDDEKVLRSFNGEPEQWLLTENGFYEVLMQSRLPQAKGFKKGIKELLRDIRTGGGVMQMQLHGYEVLPAILATLRKHVAARQRG
jgi:prophage antirepressor-like protein